MVLHSRVSRQRHKSANFVHNALLGHEAGGKICWFCYWPPDPLSENKRRKSIEDERVRERKKEEKNSPAGFRCHIHVCVSDSNYDWFRVDLSLIKTMLLHQREDSELSYARLPPPEGLLKLAGFESDPSKPLRHSLPRQDVNPEDIPGMKAMVKTIFPDVEDLLATKTRVVEEDHPAKKTHSA